ncbi:MAG: hypothetical protein AAFX02_00880 [Pseudomonadota bacterium]
MSTTIIQLTQKNTGGKLYICTAHIVAFIPYEGGSKVYDTSDDEDAWDVVETPDDILQLIVPGAGTGGGGGGSWG